MEINWSLALHAAFLLEAEKSAAKRKKAGDGRISREMYCM